MLIDLAGAGEFLPRIGENCGGLFVRQIVELGHDIRPIALAGALRIQQKSNEVVRIAGKARRCDKRGLHIGDAVAARLVTDSAVIGVKAGAVLGGRGKCCEAGDETGTDEVNRPHIPPSRCVP